MNLDEALGWVERNCDEGTCERLRSRRVAKTLADEVTRLKQVCRNVYEVWAGSEGIPLAETACESYLLHLIGRMRDEAKERL